MYYGYFDEEPETNWPVDEDEPEQRYCTGCGAFGAQPCLAECPTRSLATDDDLEERDAGDPFASDPDDLEELHRNEADDYARMEDV